MPNFHENVQSDNENNSDPTLSKLLDESKFVHNSHRLNFSLLKDDQPIDESDDTSGIETKEVKIEVKSQLHVPKTHKRTATLGGVSMNEDDGNLSVIDMYGDEVESRVSKPQVPAEATQVDNDESQDEEVPPHAGSNTSENPGQHNTEKATTEAAMTQEMLREQQIKADRRQSTFHYDRYGFKNKLITSVRQNMIVGGMNTPNIA